MKRLISCLITITLLFSLAIPTYANAPVVIENEIDMKEKYVKYLSENPELEERQIIVKFKDISSEQNMGKIENLTEGKISLGDVASGNISMGEISIADKAMTTIKKLNLSSDCDVIRTIDSSNVTILQAKTENVSDLLETLNDDESILYAQPDYKVNIAQTSIDEKQWAIQNNGQTVDRSTGESGFDINLIDAWDITRGTEEVVVGVIDTGIDISHQDLANNIWTNTKETVNGVDDDNNGYVDDIHGWDFVSEDNSVYDMDALDEHGTHMAGIIAANGRVSGVAPNIKVMPLKALNYSSGYTSDIIEAINYAKTNGVKIINCSFASIEYNPALEEAIATNPDILFVCAAGNYGKPTTEIATFPACYDLDNIITVSAANNKGQLSEFSTYGDYVDVCAPGVGIYSTIPENQYDFKDGTSCSAAYISGVASLVLSNNQDLIPIEIKNKIINSVENPLPKQNDTGSAETEGLVNVKNALLASGNIGKMDDFEYSIDDASVIRFEKYPYEFVNDSGIIKLQFDSSRLFTQFNLKLYQSTENKEHPYLVNNDIPTTVDYVIENFASNTEYSFSIKSVIDDITTEYIGTLKYVTGADISYLDFDVLSEESYGDIPNTPIEEMVYYTTEEKEALAETLSAGTKSEAEYNDEMEYADRTYDDYDNLGYMNDSDDVDYFKIKFNDSGVANFWLGNIPAGHDYDLYLYDENGVQLAYSNKSSNEQELISYYDVKADTFYYMKVTTFSGSSTSLKYLLRAKWYESYSDYEDNDTFSTAYVLQGLIHNKITEKLSSSSDVDYYYFHVPADSVFELKLSRPNSNYRFRIYSASNTSSSLTNTSANSYTHIFSSGYYYIQIFSISGYSSSNYTLTLNCHPLYSISSESIKNGTMSATTDNVFYKLVVSSDIGIQVDLTNFGSSDFDLFLYNSSFAEITSSELTETAECMQSVLGIGTYYIRVKRFDGSNLNFTIETTVVLDSNDAYLTSSGFPTEMEVGDVKTVTVYAENLGARTWTAADGYKLAALNDSLSFVSSDRTLNSSDSIGYGSSKQFTFNIIAPDVLVETSYTTGWRMKQNSLTFGDKITKSITVKPDYEELTLNSFTNVYGEATKQTYMFTVESSGYYAIRTFYYSKDCDTKLTLYNSSMTEISDNDDIFSGNYYSRIEAYLSPGVYYVDLEEFSNKELYCQLTVEEFEYTTITSGTSKNLTNEYEGYYKFTVSSSGTYIIGTKFYSQNSDTYLLLYDDEIAEDATLIDYNDDDSSNYSRIVVDLNAGTYYIRATTYDYMKDAARKKAYCKVSLTKQSSTPSVDYTADIDITYPSDNSIVRLYDGASLKISGTVSNVSNVIVKVNGSTVSGVKKSGNRFECNYTPNESGDYTIVATGSASYGGSNPSDSVNVTLLVNDDGDTFDTATSVKVGTERTAAIDYEEDIDCFMFSPSRSDMYSIYTTGSTDTVISVYNSLYALNAYNDDDYTQTSNLNADAPLYLEQNQLYYIMVHSAEQNGTGIYNLCINRLSDDNVSSKTLTYGSVLNGRIDYPEDEDVYAFYPADSGTYTFKTLGTSDVMGVVYDSHGTFMAFNDDKSETDTNCEIVVELDAGGPYYFAIKHDFSYMYKQNYQVTVE